MAHLQERMTSQQPSRTRFPDQVVFYWPEDTPYFLPIKYKGPKRFWKGFFFTCPKETDREGGRDNVFAWTNERWIPLKPGENESEFDRYRHQICTELKNHFQYFRHRFLDLIWWYPGRSCRDYRLRIWMDIKSEGVEVNCVQVEHWYEHPGERNVWKERIRAWEEFIRKWNAKNTTGIGFKQHEDYKEVGMIVFGFMVHCHKYPVFFEVQMEFPLEKSEVPRERECRKGPGVGWDWAYRIADKLSDRKPDREKFEWTEFEFPPDYRISSRLSSLFLDINRFKY